MPVELLSKLPGNLPIDVRNVRGGESAQDFEKTLIHVGNERVALAEVFDIQGDSLEDANVIWNGDLSNVSHIGYANKSGTVTVEGDAGDHVGTKMSGGEIVVKGSVRDFAGTEIQGGVIRIAKNAGDFVGGPLSGSKLGMNRGAIFISGNTGGYTGRAMRRGTIVVGGTSGPGLGMDMIAGTIVAFGELNTIPGVNMKRGTIIAANADSAIKFPGANFGFSGRALPPVIPIIANWLTTQNQQWRIANFDTECLINRKFDQYACDLVNGGRGELFVGC